MLFAAAAMQQPLQLSPPFHLPHWGAHLSPEHKTFESSFEQLLASQNEEQ
jgi:hypothetical protein